MAAAVSELVWALDQLGFLIRMRLSLEQRPLMTMEPLSYAAKCGFNRVRESCARLSRFAFLQPCADGLTMESAVAMHRVVLHDEWGISFVSNLARGRQQDATPALGDEISLTAISLLNAAGMLEGSEQTSFSGFGGELLETGEFHDLFFHRRSRYGRHDGPFGAEFPYLDTIPPLPALAPPVTNTSIPLQRPSYEDVRVRDLLLTQAIERRVSSRQHGETPLTLSEVGEFLFRCARIRGVYGPAPDAGMPYEAIDKPFPSGGGIHDLELYLIVSRVRELQAGAYHYAADRHVLERLPQRDEAVAVLLQSAMHASSASEPPHVLIKVASRFGRVSWKYRSISYATTLKNVGVLYQTMYLVADGHGTGRMRAGLR